MKREIHVFQALAQECDYRMKHSTRVFPYRHVDEVGEEEAEATPPSRRSVCSTAGGDGGRTMARAKVRERRNRALEERGRELETRTHALEAV